MRKLLILLFVTIGFSQTTFTDEEIIQNSFNWTPSQYRNFIAHTSQDISPHRLLSPSDKIKN